MSKPLLPVKQHTSHPIWRGLLCLVLGIASWWGLVKWLEPRPTWTKVIPTESKALIPLVDDSSRNLLVCLESKRGTPPHSETLVIFSLDRGEELYRTSIPMSHSSELYYSESWRPRFVGDQLCWLTKVESQDRFDFSNRPIELRVWKHQKGESNHPIKTWQLPDAFTPKFHFPKNSRVVIVQQTFPLQYLLAMNSQSFGMSLSSCCEWPRLIRWYETWSVPQSPEETVKLLARWSPPADRWQMEMSLSGDGRWAAFAECTNSYSTIARKARTTGLNKFNGDELFKLYRGDSSGLLVFDATTGKQRHQLLVPAKAISAVYWAGDILRVYLGGFSNHFNRTLKEIEESEKEDGIELGRYRDYDTQYYLLNEKSLTQICCPEGDLSMINGILTLLDQRNRCIHEVYPGGDRLIIQHTLAEFESQLGGNFWWVRNSGQSVSLVKTPRPEVRFLREWAERWPILTTFADWLERGSKSRLSIQGPHYETTLSLKPYQEVWNLRVNDFSQLYLWGYATMQPESKDYTLQAYDLPFKLYSPWWGRGLGLFFFLLTLFLLSWRARGRVTHQI